MDTSETYIKMRLAAIPDLGAGKKALHPSYELGNNVWGDCKGDWYYSPEPGAEYCQLERQDRLQEMIAKVSSPRLFAEFLTFLGWDGTKFINDSYPMVSPPTFTSMEQLWLVFCMAENHNKVWDGEQWIKTDKRS